MVQLFSVLLFFLPVVVQSQSYILTGEVIDRATLSKIEGVHITYDGYKGVVTDKNGSFSIPISDSTSRKKLTFSHVGYKSKRVMGFGSKRNRIILNDKAIVLGAVTITPNKSILEQAIENIPVNYPTTLPALLCNEG